MSTTKNCFATAVLLGAVICWGPVKEVSAGEKELVDFRLQDWKSAHFDDAPSAQEHYETLKRIGCEVKQERHGGHYDVRYRSSKWRSIAMKSHKEAEAWERWLKAYGFETSHRH